MAESSGAAPASAKSGRVREELRRVYTVLSRLAMDFLLIPDATILWAPFAIVKALQVVRNEDIGVIYSTGPPFGNLLIAYLVSLLTGLPLVIDYRDRWGGSPGNLNYQDYNRYRVGVETFMEKVIMKRAARIICNTQAMAETIKAIYPSIPAGRFVEINNGYDADDFKHPDPVKRFDRFTVTYTGGLALPKTPDFILKAFRQLIEEHPDLRGKIQLMFVGPFPEVSKPLAEGLPVVCTGLVSHDRSIEYMMRSDVLMLMLFEEEDGRIVLPSKLFEYMAAGKPILATVPESATADLVTAEKLGMVVAPRDLTGIKDAIAQLYERHINGSLDVGTACLKKYERKEIAKQLAAVFDEVSGRAAGDKPQSGK